MPALCLTYAAKDNEDGDADFVAQELRAAGLTVRPERWEVGAGRRLWEQVGGILATPKRSAAWVLFATADSLGSQDELGHALDQAVAARGDTFAVVALFPSPVPRRLLPPGLRVRLAVSLRDPRWAERIRAAAQPAAAAGAPARVPPYALRVHPIRRDQRPAYAVEVRPRAGRWSPFVAAVPLGEQEALRPSILFGPKGRVPEKGDLTRYERGPSEDGTWWLLRADDEASPTHSYFVFCDALPSTLLFGGLEDSPQYRVVRRQEGLV